MKDCTNNGCQCTPNQSINCTVNNCAHHCQDSNYCGLTSIRVGTHETNPTEIKCTDYLILLYIGCLIGKNNLLVVFFLLLFKGSLILFVF